MPFALFLAILVPAAEFIIGFALLLNLKPKYAIWGLSSLWHSFCLSPYI